MSNASTERQSATGLVCRGCRWGQAEIERLRANLETANKLSQADGQIIQANADEIKRLQAIVDKLRGGIADLQRHIKARSLDDPPVFIPAAFCAIVGVMHKAAEAKEK